MDIPIYPGDKEYVRTLVTNAKKDGKVLYFLGRTNAFAMSLWLRESFPEYQHVETKNLDKFIAQTGKPTCIHGPLIKTGNAEKDLQLFAQLLCSKMHTLTVPSLVNKLEGNPSYNWINVEVGGEQRAVVGMGQYYDVFKELFVNCQRESGKDARLVYRTATPFDEKTLIPVLVDDYVEAEIKVSFPG